MSVDPAISESVRLRHWITDVEVTPGNTDPDCNFSARIFIDEQLVCNLPGVDHTRRLRWSGLLLCDVSPSSNIVLRLCKSTKGKPRYFNFPATTIAEVDEETGESVLELPEAVWVVTIRSLTSTMQQQQFPGQLKKADEIEGEYDGLEPGATAKYLFKTALRFANFVVETLPECAVKLSFLIYMKAWEVLDQQTQVDNTIQDILRGMNDIEKMLDVIGRASNLTLPAAVNRSKEPLLSILVLLEDISIYILDHHGKNDLLHRPSGEAESSHASTAGLYLARLEELIKEFLALWSPGNTTSMSSIEMPETDDEPATILWQIDQKLTDDSTTNSDPFQVLSFLQPMYPSDYDPDQTCMEGTRKIILNKIINWTQNREHSERLMWISGQAGMGKTAIAASLCQSLDAIHALAGCFFGRREPPDSSDPLRLLNGLIYAIALRLPPYAHEVAHAIRTDRSLCASHFSRRYDSLVKRPLEKLKTLSVSKILVVVIDALDECGDRQSHLKILQKFHEISRLAPWLKVIFTSRPERVVQDYFHKNCSHEPIVHLQNYDASDDICAYIEHHLGEIAQAGRWPQGSLHQLCERSEGVFLWAVLATNYIKGSVFPTTSRLRILLDNRQSPVTDHFDALYTKVLSTLIQDTDDGVQETYARCISGFLATSDRKPLTPSSIQYLPLVVGQIDPGAFECVVNDLGSLLLQIDGQYSKFYHSSFKDFISDRSRCGDFFIKTERYDADHGSYCLQVMQEDLCFNICKLESSHLFNNEVPDLRLRVRSHIGPPLKYACIHWIDHFISAPSQALVKAIISFWEGPQLMYWIEVLSLLGRVDVAITGLSKLKSLELSRFGGWHRVVSWAKDLHRFLLTFRDIITASTPHLYLSALAFAPHKSPTAQRMRPFFPNIIQIARGADSNWHPCVKFIVQPYAVQSLSISPDGSKALIGYSDGSLSLWDIENGSLIRGTSTAHTDSVTCVAFSPSNRHAASGSYDNTVRVWDIVAQLKTSSLLAGHCGPVHSVTFSPNNPIIASGSADMTIRLWDLKSMGPVGEPYVGHSGDVGSVTFSPDGTKLVSGSFDKTIRVWSVQPHTSTLAGSPLLITGHSDLVTCVTFSPDGLNIVSGSADKTMRIWNAQTGKKSEFHPTPIKHSHTITSIIFSTDGKLIASSSPTGALQLWDATTLSLFSHPFGHTNIVNGIAFLPNGTSLISGSVDRTIRIWDVSACPKAITMAPITGHSSPILAIAVSGDGTRVISVSSDRMVQIWDAQTGASIGNSHVIPNPEPVRTAAHNKYYGGSQPININCVVISHQGTQIVFSNGQYIVLWDTITCSTINSHQFPSAIHCAVFSPEGSLVAFGCADRQIYLWEIAGWEMLGTPLQGHSDSVKSVDFSSDGASLASTGGHTVLLWDIKTLSRSGVSFSKNNPSNSNYNSGKPQILFTSTVFSPCGTRLVSHSANGEAWLWDRKTGAEILQLVSTRGSNAKFVFSPDGSCIIATRQSGDMQVWNAKTGESIHYPFATELANLASITFSPDGNYIFGFQNTTIRVGCVDTSNLVNEHEKNLAGAFCWPANPYKLSPHLHHPGWVKDDEESLAFWLPAHYQQPAQFFNAHTQTPTLNAFLDYSRFVHGSAWTSVARNSIKSSSK